VKTFSKALPFIIALTILLVITIIDGCTPAVGLHNCELRTMTPSLIDLLRSIAILFFLVNIFLTTVVILARKLMKKKTTSKTIWILLYGLLPFEVVGFYFLMQTIS